MSERGAAYRGTSLMRKRPPPYDPPITQAQAYDRVLGGSVFKIREVPLCSAAGHQGLDGKALLIYSWQGSGVDTRLGSHPIIMSCSKDWAVNRWSRVDKVDKDFSSRLVLPRLVSFRVRSSAYRGVQCC